MTQDQIKAITEEYARRTCADNTYDNIHEREVDEQIEYDFALPIIKWLNEKYCIVEREKVMVELDKTRVLYEGRSDVSIYMQNALYRIFGTSMFN